MTSSMTKIQTITVIGSSTPTISFTNIPNTYTDLVIKISARSNSAVYYTPIWMQINSITTGYTNRFLDVYNNGVTSATDWFGVTNKMPLGAATGASDTASTFSNCEAYIPNYAGSAYKTVYIDAVTENNSGTNNQWYQFLSANLLSNTAVISSLSLTLNAGNFVEYSTATLYGVTKYVETGTGSKAIGGTVTTSGGYTYHTFFSSGVFTPTTSITGAEVLVVAGGGGGSSTIGGAGGAGGLVYASSQSYTSGVNYAAIIGAGGQRGADYTNANNGTNSSFAAGTVAVGGGYGSGGGGSNAGGNGGSGGGAGYNSGNYAGGTATAGQGNAGGGTGSTGNAGGGGGGAGAAGGTPGNNYAGNGGNGVNTYSAWATATSTGYMGYYAGGGGGGARTSTTTTGGVGGKGGGGNGAGSANTIAQAGLSNTGGGGGGGAVTNNLGASGGSGIVIIRYTT